MNNMNKSNGILKSMFKMNINKGHHPNQTMEINRSNRFTPSKKPQKKIFSINNKGNINSNFERIKKYQQSLQKYNINNMIKSSKNRKNIDKNVYFKNMFNGSNIPNSYKNNPNNSKTINNSKNKNYNTSLQKKMGSKSYVNLFQNNMYNNNEHIPHGAGLTISNSIYEKIYDFEIQNNNNSNINNNENNDNNSNEYKTFVSEVNNIINVLLNYINIIKKEYEKIIIKKVQSKDKEISKLKSEKEYLIQENKNLKYKIIEMFYCIKRYENNKDKNKDKNLKYIKLLLNENTYLRSCTDKSNNINKSYFMQLENDIRNQISQKELLIQKKIEEEKNNQNAKIDNNNNKENEQNNDKNPFITINNNSGNNANSKINHKRQRTQFKLGFPLKSENNNKINEEEKLNSNRDVLSDYLNVIKNNTLLLSKAENSSQKNLLIGKKNNENVNEDKNKKEGINNNNLSIESDTDTIVHVDNNNDTINNKTCPNNENNNTMKDTTNKILQGLHYSSPDDKYIRRIEFTK